MPEKIEMKIIDLKSAPLIWSTDTVPLKGSVMYFGSPNKQISPYESTNFIHENDLTYMNLLYL